LKTYLRGGQSVLRSKTPNGVAQELYALLVVYQLVQVARARAARDHPLHDDLDPDRISFTVTLRALARTIGNRAGTGRLFHDVLEEVWSHPLIHRRPRAKPRGLKGTPAFSRAITTTPPGRITYKITTRSPAATPA
jgi:hypothetical protein